MKPLKLSLGAVLAFLLLQGMPVFAQKITVSGFISNASSGEPLIAAGVRYGTAGTVSNNFGFYSLQVPAGDLNIEYSYVGYESLTIMFHAAKDTVVNVRLRTSFELSSAKVIAPKATGIQSTGMSAVDIPIAQIKLTPSILGERDVLKTIQLMPGVQSGTNGFTGLYVRGGGPDENLLMLDGIALYNADHLLGLFSVFMPEAVKRVTLYKGSFPARYGGRVSSVVDVRTNDGNMEECHGTVNVGVLSSKLHLEGPLAKGKTAYSVSARLMHTIFAQPLIAAFNPKDQYNFWFYDMNGKISHRLGRNDRLSLNVYNGKDKLRYKGEDKGNSSENESSYEYHENSKSDISWGNTVVSGSWNHVYGGGKLFSNATVAFNRYGLSVLSGDKELRVYTDGIVTNNYTDIDYNSGIDDLNAMVDFDFSPSPSHMIRFGVDFISHRFSPETYGASSKVDQSGTIIADTSYVESGDHILHGQEISAYVEDDISVGERLSFNPGLHVSSFLVSGKNWISLQPRLAVRFDLGEGFAVKASYSRMSQNIHLLSSTQITLPMDLWVPVTRNIRPVISDQFGTGFYYDGLDRWEFSLEGYFKSLDNVLEYKDGVVILGNTSNWQDKVVMGEGRSMGIELLVQKVAGKTTGWLSYTLAKTDRRFPDGSISNGEWFPYKYDRRHNLSLIVNHKFSKRVDVSGTWSFATGGVLTVPVRQITVLSPDGKTLHQTDLLSSRGNYRLQPSHRLNIGINFRKQKKHGERVWNFSVYNIYDQMSPDLIDIETDKSYWGHGIYVTKGRLRITTLLPVIPSFGYAFNF